MTVCFDKSDNSDNFESLNSVIVSLGVIREIIMDSPQSKTCVSTSNTVHLLGSFLPTSKGYAFADLRGVSEDKLRFRSGWKEIGRSGLRRNCYNCYNKG